MNGLLRGVLLVAVFQVGCGPGAIMGPIDAGAGGGTAGGTGGSAGGSAGGAGGGSAGGSAGGGSAGGAGGGSAGGTGGAAGGSAGGTGGTGGTGGGAPPAITPGGPVLFFSDLVNAPRTGNSDTSKGQTANADGAFVTVWGKRLGATQGTSMVTVGGVAARVYSWGPATKPANLSVRMGLDMIELQIPGTAPLGAAPIVVTVNGTASNPLDFTTRATGKISFVAQTGSDSNAGTFAAPWKTFDKVASSIGNGDVAYLMDGFVDTTDSIDNACIGLNSDGAPGAPKALAAYPGATAKVSGTCGGVGAYSYSLNRDTKHWVISKLTIDSTGVTDTLMTLSSGYRAVGNSISNPHTSDGCQSGTVGCGGLGPCGDDIFFLGNEIKNVMQVNQATGSKQCHTVYISGDRQHNGVEKNRDIGWNYIHDCYDNRAINIYNESFNGASGQRVQIENHRVHDNWIENHRGVGILMGLETTGDNLIYNNVLINTGFGPDWSEGISGHFPLQLNPGSPQNARPSTLRVFHNTIKGTGFASNPGLIHYEPASATTFELKNNVVVSTSSTIPYLSPDSVTLAAGMNRNLWFGAGAKPAFDANGVSGDPKFTSTTDFHLGAGSAAKSAATPLPNAPLDFDGIPRSATTPSIGAFE